MTESEGKKDKEAERVRGSINFFPSFIILQWIAAVAADKTSGFFFLLSSLVIICSEMPGWRYDNNTAKAEGTQLERKR